MLSLGNEEIEMILKKRTHRIYSLNPRIIEDKFGSRFENISARLFSKFVDPFLPLNCFEDAIKELFPKRFIKTNIEVFRIGRKTSLSSVKIP